MSPPVSKFSRDERKRLKRGEVKGRHGAYLDVLVDRVWDNAGYVNGRGKDRQGVAVRCLEIVGIDQEIEIAVLTRQVFGEHLPNPDEAGDYDEREEARAVRQKVVHDVDGICKIDRGGRLQKLARELDPPARVVRAIRGDHNAAVVYITRDPDKLTTDLVDGYYGARMSKAHANATDNIVDLIDEDYMPELGDTMSKALEKISQRMLDHQNEVIRQALEAGDGEEDEEDDNNDDKKGKGKKK